jgi:hypothetical protein
MAKVQTIKVRCNGAGGHVNEIDLEKIVKPVVVTRSAASSKPHETPQRSVFKCKFCQEGKIVITREMVEEALK